MNITPMARYSEYHTYGMVQWPPFISHAEAFISNFALHVRTKNVTYCSYMNENIAFIIIIVSL